MTPPPAKGTLQSAILIIEVLRMIGAMTSLRFVGASAAFIVCRHSLVGKRSLFASDRQVEFSWV